MLLGVLAVPCLMMAEQVSDIMTDLERGISDGYCLDAVLSGLQSDAVLMAFPVICALPYAASFTEDRKTGIYRSLLLRTSYRDYIWSKGLACAISGGLVLVLGIALAALLSALILGCLEPAAVTFEGESLRAGLRSLLRYMLLYFLSGALWSVFGMLTAMLTGSMYLAYLAPFSGYYLLIIFHERYFRHADIIYPKLWLTVSEDAAPGYWTSVLWVSELLLLLLFIFRYSAERKIADV